MQITPFLQFLSDVANDYLLQMLGFFSKSAPRQRPFSWPLRSDVRANVAISAIRNRKHSNLHFTGRLQRQQTGFYRPLRCPRVALPPSRCLVPIVAFLSPEKSAKLLKKIAQGRRSR
jgi:hypothetical protein